MGLFDFFRNKKEAECDSELERSLRKAASGEIPLVDFYDTVRSAEVYVLSDGELPADGDTSSLSLLSFDNGTIPIFSSIERVMDNRDGWGDDTCHAAIPVLTLFAMNLAGDFALNPYSPYGKKFTRQEAENIVSGVYRKMFSDVFASADMKVMLSEPKDPPRDLVKKLYTTFSKEPDVFGVWLLLLHDPERKGKGIRYLAVVDMGRDLAAWLEHKPFMPGSALPEGCSLDFASMDIFDPTLIDGFTPLYTGKKKK